MICPLQVARDCYKKECEWWLDGECAIITIAKGYRLGIRSNDGYDSQTYTATSGDIEHTGGTDCGCAGGDYTYRVNQGGEERNENKHRQGSYYDAGWMRRRY